MSYVDVLAVEVVNNPAKYCDPLSFKITFRCNAKTQEDLEWRITWVGSAKDEKYDQILDEVAVPPDLGICSFELEVDAPDSSKIPGSEILGVTVVMVQALYKGKEFVRVGYYVKVEYSDENLREEAPDVETPDVKLLERNILHTEPRVTRYLIDWDDQAAAVSSVSVPQDSGNPATAGMQEQPATGGVLPAAAGVLPQPIFQQPAVAASGR